MWRCIEPGGRRFRRQCFFCSRTEQFVSGIGHYSPRVRWNLDATSALQGSANWIGVSTKCGQVSNRGGHHFRHHGVIVVDASPVLYCPQNTNKSPNNKDTGSTSAAVFCTRTFCVSPLAPNVPIEANFSRACMSFLVHSRECAEATALFVSSFGVDLVAKVVGNCGSRRLKN